MRRGSKEVFMTCLELSRFITTGTLKSDPSRGGKLAMGGLINQTTNQRAGVEPDRACVHPAASWCCILVTACLAPPSEERNRKPSAASSKQARLGTTVSQFRKLRFPLTIRVAWETHRKVLPRENGAPTWKRICSAPLTIHMRRPRKVKKGATSSMKWLESVSKRWNHQGERCM
ncbi:hypothetical protein JZ751_013357 [Albula glossodonta]|uniref:Uncharacterized protein n=1 Tax=Albula glossodonta TaxID=121402 RepID=A0A8T2MYI1_9TELE|nr:hypothetical protein JZ751_013357 [Albula glossodonta]